MELQGMNGSIAVIPTGFRTRTDDTERNRQGLDRPGGLGYTGLAAKNGQAGLAAQNAETGRAAEHS